VREDRKREIMLGIGGIGYLTADEEKAIISNCHNRKMPA